MLRTRPIMVYILTIAVPPALMNGSGTPITGAVLSTIPIFIIQCEKMSPKAPMQMNLPRWSRVTRLSAKIFRQM